jgi:hypothetical protein
LGFNIIKSEENPDCEINEILSLSFQEVKEKFQKIYLEPTVRNFEVIS